MIIHFICTGNMYRSRIAEACCASKCLKGLQVRSSGIGTAFNGGGAISPYAAQVLHEYGIERFASPLWKQTTAASVRDSDVLIFMEPQHEQFCRAWIDYARHLVEVWNIPDVGPGKSREDCNIEARRIFSEICVRLDIVLRRLDFPMT